MKRALLAAGWMMALVAGATGCIRVADLPSTVVAPDEPDARKRIDAGVRLAAACQDGTVPRHRAAAACLILAGYHDEGIFGFPRDPGRAAMLWESAVDILQASCAVGEVEDCTRAATAIGMGYPPGSAPGAAMAAESARWMVEYAEDGCRGGHAAGCALLGRIYERGHGVARDDGRAMAYYDEACGRGHRQSCLFLASRAEGSDTVRAFERACRAGSGFGCATAAEHHRKGAGVEPSIERAGALFASGCSLGDPASCVLGAEMYASDPAADQRRAAKFAWAGCEQGIAGACLVLGELTERAVGRSQSRKVYRRACELGEPKGCDAARAPSRPDEQMEYELGD